MINDLFQVDWISVDIIIILFLVLLLFAVKCFKATYRWRMDFSSNNLEFYSFSKMFIDFKSRFIKAKRWNLTKNSLITRENARNLSILILRTNQKRTLIKTLTEGLASYGFTIVNTNIKIKSNSKIGNEIINKELMSFLSSAFDNFKKKGLINSSNYITINYSKSLIPVFEILSEPDNKALILINPIINKMNLEHFKKIQTKALQHFQLFYIFSGKNVLILKNKNLKYFLKELNDKNSSKVKLITLEESNRNFKYYETILLGIIIDIIENKILESKISE